jgi:hypothetical protein
MTMFLKYRATSPTGGILTREQSGEGKGNNPGGGPAQHAVRPELGGGIRARIEAATSRRNDATTKKELDWQGRVEGDATRIAAFRDQALN